MAGKVKNFFTRTINPVDTKKAQLERAAAVAERASEAGLSETGEVKTAKWRIKPWAIIVAGVLLLGGVAWATVSQVGKDKVSSENNQLQEDLSNAQEGLTDAENKLGDAQGKLDEVIKDNEKKDEELAQLKDNRSFEPTADQIKTIQSYQGQRIFTLKDMAEYNYNKADKELTIWFNAIDGDGQKALVSYSGSTNFKGDSFSTNDIMDWAKSQDKNDQLNINVYQSLESYAEGSGAEALAKAVQAKVSADKGATTKVDVEFEGETDTMEVATTTPVWVCVERASNSRGETVKVSLASGVGSEGKEGKDIETTQVSTLTGKIVSNADVINKVAETVGAVVEQEVEAE